MNFWSRDGRGATSCELNWVAEKRQLALKLVGSTEDCTAKLATGFTLMHDEDVAHMT